jgi:phosphoribulokinase
MSKKHPIIAVTGSSGAGTTSVKLAMEQIFRREGVSSILVEGDSFHRFDRAEMKSQLSRADREHRNLSHFGPEGNELKKLESLFRQYGKTGKGQRRFYIHSDEEAEIFNQPAGTFTPWEVLDEGSDLLFYEGLHGGAITPDLDISSHVDLLVGVVPIVNLEWIQKIHRDTAERGYSAEAVTDTILRRMYDYVKHITPQFSKTDINFQRVPMVDTSNPFVAREIPSMDESMVVIRFRDPKKYQVDFNYLLTMIHGSFMSRRNSIVVPGGKMGLAVELIIQPMVEDLIRESVNYKNVAKLNINAVSA